MPSTLCWPNSSLNIFLAANPTKVILLTHFNNALFWVIADRYSQCGFVALLDLWLRTFFQFQCKQFFWTDVFSRFQSCSCCSLCFDILIRILFDLFAFSALVSAFQYFTRKHCLQFSGGMCSVTLTWNRFLITKIAARFTCVAFVKTSYTNTDACKFESLQN